MTGQAKLLSTTPSLIPSIADDEIGLAQRCLWLCIFFQLIIWIGLPALLVQGAYVDVLENWEWGRHFQWGYDKDPMLAAWLTYWVLHWSKSALWTTYLVSQLSVISALFAVWCLAKRILPPLHALVSVSMLITVFFYNIGATELNDDVMELGLWALTILFFYDALIQQKYYQWLLVGFFAALASMDKYFTLMLLLAMLTFLLSNAEARRSWKKGGLYCGLLLFTAMVMPNFIWLITHSFVAIDYAFNSAAVTASGFANVLTHLANPLIFIISMAAVVLLLMPLLWAFFGKEKSAITVNRFDRQFLFIIFFGPFAYVLLFLLLTGAKFRFVWATPLFNFVGILLMLWFKPLITPKNLRLYFVTVALFVGVWMAMYIGNETVTPFFRHDLKHRFEFYPGKAMAATLTQAWEQRYHSKLAYVAGDREVVVYITYYSPDHPHGYFDWNEATSQWIDEKQLKKQGAIFVWNNGNAKTASLDPAIRARFPNVSNASMYTFDWAFSHWLQRWWDLPEPAPLKLGVAFLPPAQLTK